MIPGWLSDNWIELFGAVTGIIYVFLEIRQNLWLWPVGITTSAVYIWIFFSGKIYADMSLQGYYLVISCIGWYWWVKGTGQGAKVTEQRAQSTERRAQSAVEKGRWGETGRSKGKKDKETKGQRDEGNERIRDGGTEGLNVTRLRFKTGIILAIVFVLLYLVLWFVLSRYTDSPLPEADSFITSLSIVATWMLARKIYEHWFLWIAVNSVASMVFFIRGLYPTVFLYMVYLIMSFAGLKVWNKSIKGVAQGRIY